MQYLATFYTHFAAQYFARRLKKQGIAGKMMPTPRSVSASCGSCVSFDLEGDFLPLLVEDTEAVYLQETAGFVRIWAQEG